MRYFKFLIIGILFGITLIKSEAMSWFRIQEMFRFQSFHMYGIFASGILVGAITVFLIKRYKLTTINNEEILLEKKTMQTTGNIIGGSIFGFGWALTGCCVAPIYVLIGNGYIAAVIMLISALVGVFVYGLVREKLPH